MSTSPGTAVRGIAVLILCFALATPVALATSAAPAASAMPAIAPGPAPAATAILIDSFNASTNFNAMAGTTSVADVLSVMQDFLGTPPWSIGDGVYVSGPSTTNFTVSNAPNLPNVTAFLTNGIDNVIQVSVNSPTGNGAGSAMSESSWLRRNPDLIGYDIDFVHLVVTSLSFTPSGNVTLVAEDYTWQFWGHPTYVTFTPPTAPNGTWLIDGRDTTVSVRLAAPATPVLEWNGASLSMAPTDGTGMNWSLSVTNLSNGLYEYRVWATNGTGATFVSDARTLTVAVGVWGFAPIGTGFYPQLAYDSTGNPHVCFFESVAGNPVGLIYGSHDAAGWHLQTVAAANATATQTGQSCSLVLDSQGLPRISFVEGPAPDGTLTVTYAAYNGSAWSVTPVHEGPYTLTSLALNPRTGDPLVAFADPSQKALEVTELSGGTWITESIDLAFTGWDFALTADAQGNPGIAYVSGSQLVWATSKGTSWTKTVVDPVACGAAPCTLSAQLDSHGLPHIAYLSRNAVKYASFDGTAWSAETVDWTPSAYVAMTLDADDHPHLVYAWTTGGQLHYAVGPGTWVGQLVADDYGGAGFAIATDPNGTAAIAYDTTTVGELGLLRCTADCTPPLTRAVLNGTAGSVSWFRSDVAVTLVPRDGTAVQNTSYQVDQGPWLPYAAPFTVGGYGNHTLRYSSTDTAGNVEPVETTTFGIDTVAPVAAAQVSGTQSPSGWYGSPVLVTLTGSDNLSGVARIAYRVDGGPWSNYTGPFTDLNSGNDTVEFQAVDRAGNVGNLTSLHFSEDIIAPGLTLDPLPSVVTTSRVTIRWSGADMVSGIASYAVRVDAGPLAFVGLNTSLTANLADGTHTITVQARDGAGNVRNASETFRVDTNLFSPSGPYAGAPTYAIIVAAVLGVAAWLVLRRRRGIPRRNGPAPEPPQAPSPEAGKPPGPPR